MFQPTGNRVAVKIIEEQMQKQGGIYIPTTAVESYVKGVVVAVGSGSYQNGVLVSVNLKVNDTVLFSKQGGVEVGDGDEKLIVVTETAVIGVIK